VRSSPHADPARGVFETLLVLDGHAVEVDAHVERLAASVSTLFDVRLSADARQSIDEGARGVRQGKLRITVVPNPAGHVEMAVSADEVDSAQVFPSPNRALALRSFVAAGGLGSHKWADRQLLDRFAASAADDELPLLLDANGTVLEASRANVFVSRDGTLSTPPADGRIVPGIARRRTIELARAGGQDVREEQLSLDDLFAADEVFLTNSVRGVEPVRSIDGRDVSLISRPYGHSIDGASARAGIASALRRRWWLPVPQGESVAVAAGGRRGDRPAR